MTKEIEAKEFLKQFNLDGNRGELRIDQLEFLLRKFGQEQYTKGAKDSCGVCDSLYASTSYHKNMIGDCTLAKMNIIPTTEIKKNLTAFDAKEYTKQEAIGFAEWANIAWWSFMKHDGKWHNMVDNTLEGCTTDQLYTLYQTQKPKTNG